MREWAACIDPPPPKAPTAGGLRHAARRRAVTAEAGGGAPTLSQKSAAKVDAGPQGLRPAKRFDMTLPACKTKAAARDGLTPITLPHRASARVKLARCRRRVDAASGRDGGSADRDVRRVPLPCQVVKRRQEGSAFARLLVSYSR